MAEQKVVSRKDFEAKIVASAWRDPEYKKRLLKNPKQVVEEELQGIADGVELPKDLQVAVHEESPTQYHLVLPRNPNEIAPGAVADEHLEAIAPQTIAVVVANINNTVNNLAVAVITGPAVVSQIVGINQVTAQVSNVVNAVVNQVGVANVNTIA
jgi:hypothetical protein